MSSVIEQTQESVVPTETTPGRAMLAAVSLLAVAAIGSLAIPTGFAALYAALGLEQTLLLTTVAGVVATLFLGVLAVAYLRIHHVEIPIRRPVGWEWAWIAGGLALSLVAAIVFAVLEGLFASEAAASAASTTAAGASMVTVLIAAVYFMLVVGPVEEYLFRGVVQGRLRQHYGPAVAIGLTSVGFALGHVPSFWLAGSDVLSAGVAIAVLSIAAGSVILGGIYERTANLTVVAVAHGLTNTAFVVLVALLA